MLSLTKTITNDPSLIYGTCLTVIAQWLRKKLGFRVNNTQILAYLITNHYNEYKDVGKRFFGNTLPFDSQSPLDNFVETRRFDKVREDRSRDESIIMLRGLVVGVFLAIVKVEERTKALTKLRQMNRSLQNDKKE